MTMGWLVDLAVVAIGLGVGVALVIFVRGMVAKINAGGCDYPTP